MTTRICFWVTTFQSDVQALACFLAEQPDFDVVVAMQRPEDYLKEPVGRLLPYRGRMLDRDARTTPGEILRHRPDVLVVDNHLPPKKLAPRIHVLWHGFGWRVDDLTTMKKELARLVGDVTVPNRNFRWQAFGEWDRRYRVDHSGIDAENVVALGPPYSDLLAPDGPVAGRFAKADVQSNYTIDLSKKTILVGLTWHHDGAFGHWGDETALLRRLFDHVESLGANVLLRMHDRHRYEKSYVGAVEEVVRGRSHVQLKFKSDSPDSLVDLLVSDALISNYSSLLNTFYYTEKPTLHVDPSAPAGREQTYRQLRGGKVRKVKMTASANPWKLPPTEVGGLRACSFDELLVGVERALSDPGCCRELARAFCMKYIAPLGGVRERTAAMLRDFTQ